MSMMFKTVAHLYMGQIQIVLVIVIAFSEVHNSISSGMPNT